MMKTPYNNDHQLEYQENKEISMKKLVLLPLITIVLACGQTSKWDENSTTYQVAKGVSENLPILSPDENKTLVTTNDFSIDVKTLFNDLKSGMGSNFNSLSQLSVTEQRDFIGRYLSTMVETRLLETAAKQRGINVTLAKIDSIYEKLAQANGGEEQFVAMLEKNDLDIASLKDEIKSSLYKDQFLTQYVYKQIQISEDELFQSYQMPQKATVRHILLSTKGKTDAEKTEILEKMKMILKQAKDGADFAKLAEKYSEDPGSNDKGGLYERFDRGVMVPEFDKAAFTVAIGEISDIIETRFGYHILKVISRESETRPFDSVKEDLEKTLLNKKRQNAYDETIKSLKVQLNYKNIFS
jgi:foldase protein PrsA